MLKLIEVIKYEQLINDKNIIFSSKYKGRKYIILDFLSKTPEKKENILLGLGEKFKYIQEFNEIFYFDDNLEDIIKNFKIHKYKKNFFNLMFKAFIETDKIKKSTKNKLKLYFNLE
jgi:putative TPR-repeat-containing protein